MNRRAAFIWWNGRMRSRAKGQVVQEQRAVLRTGNRGYGWLVRDVWFVPGDSVSIASAQKLFDQAARDNGLVIVGSDRDAS